MSNAQWSSGESLAGLVPGGIILMDAEHNDVLREYYDAMVDGAMLVDIMRSMNRRWDSLTDIPAFAMAFLEDDGVRVAVRGHYSVSAGDQVVDGSNAISWVETKLPRDGELIIGLVGETTYPSQGGIVPASGLRVNFEDFRPAPGDAGAEEKPERPTEPAEEPVAEPSPAVAAVADEDVENDVVAEDSAVTEPEPAADEATEAELEAEPDVDAAHTAAAEPEEPAVAPDADAEPTAEAKPSPASEKRLRIPRPAMLSAAERSNPHAWAKPEDDELDERVLADKLEESVEPEGEAELEAQAETAVDHGDDRAPEPVAASSPEAGPRDLENTRYPEDDDEQFSDLLVNDRSEADEEVEYPEPNVENQRPREKLDVAEASAEGGAGMIAVPDFVRPRTGDPVRPTDAAAQEQVQMPASKTEPVNAGPRTGDQVSPPPENDGDGGDHDGETIVGGKVTEIRKEVDPAKSVDMDISSKTLSARCENGHPNPPYSVECRDCGSPVSKETEWLDRPNLGVLTSENGVKVNLDADIIIGRKPSSSPEPGRARPHLLTVPSPDQQISRNHCEVRVDGWDMRVIDRNSNNGTFLLRPGQNPVRVSSMSPSILNVGDVIDIGEGIRFTVER